MTMIRLPKSPVLSLCLIALVGYGTYVPLEKIRSAQADAASQPVAINAISPDLQSRSEGDASLNAKATVSLALEGGRSIENTGIDLTDLADKTL